MADTHQDAWEYPGARWWKFDFHIHTPASPDWKGDDYTSPEDWLLAFMQAKIDCVAITDHNTGRWIDKLKTAYENLKKSDCADFRPIYIFPGVEITAAGGVHVLAIFDPRRAAEDISELLGAVDVKRDQTEEAAKQSLVKITETVAQKGAVVIPAHADLEKGIWNEQGNTLKTILKNKDIIAVEVIDRTKPKPQIYVESQLEWTEVIGSDLHHLPSATDEPTSVSRYTWVKMATPNIEGLRLALLDGSKFSVVRADDADASMPPPIPRQCIRAIEIDKARYMGRNESAKLEFSPWLNVLIGGRGTGKSTVLHCLRLAARREAELRQLGEHSSTWRNFSGFNHVATVRGSDGGLTSDSHITWTHSKDGRQYQIHFRQDTNADDTLVEMRDGNGDWLRHDVQDVYEQRFPIRIFGQGQIAELAGEDQSALLHLIDEGASVADDKARYEECRSGILKARAHLRQLDIKLTQNQRASVALEDIRQQLATWEQSGHTEVIQEYERGQQQRHEIERYFEMAQRAIRSIIEVAEELRAEDPRRDSFNAEDSGDESILSIIDAIRKGVDQSGKELADVAARLATTLNEQRRMLATGIWQRRYEEISLKYDSLDASDALETDGSSSYSQSYGNLMHERRRLEGELRENASLAAERTETIERLEAEMSQLQLARRAISDKRARFLSETIKDNEYVRIELVNYGDNLQAAAVSLREALELESDRFENDIGGPGGDPSDTAIINSLFRDLPSAMEERTSRIEDRLDKLRERFILACTLENQSSDIVFSSRFDNNLRTKYNRRPEFLDRILAWSPPDSLHVEYSISGNGRAFRPIHQGSAGQRAAAMLALLLAYGNEPLILDQPEDDLDNQLIYDLIVQQIRDSKRRRQIVIVTHNPNIVVNGDAEMVHVLDFIKGQCVVSQRGSLQDAAVREDVCRVMEGGRDALERRYRRLEMTTTDV
ncbi:TrlF family AAA-like ATPase [Candidatus Poriferisodalis sp.]|uniref:TrlF family AAA-like ATPase n=1 Tax=Candidatus Poriferisodalis sp. TaxID=3101277 RepID=UPI003B02E82D